MNKDTKMIRVTSRGFVTTSRGRVMSPIMSPYRETINRIWGMITTDRAIVEEQLPDKSFVKLTTQNFDKDNYVSKEKKVFEKPNMVPVNKTNTFVNTDNDKKDDEGEAEQKQEDNASTENRNETPEENSVVGESAPEDSKLPESETNSEDNDKKDDEGEAEQKQEDNASTEEHTVTINGEKRVDPRFNKKNNKKNHNNNNQNNSSIAVNPESVQ